MSGAILAKGMDLSIPLALVPAAAALGTMVVNRGHKKRTRQALEQVDVPGTTRDAALLVALGFDPARCRLMPTLKPYKGLRVVDVLGRPMGFFTEKSLRKDKVRKAYREALRATTVST